MIEQFEDFIVTVLAVALCAFFAFLPWLVSKDPEKKEE